jgi:hypothetical protein
MTSPEGADDDWLEDWVYGEPLPPPAAWGRPGLALLFNLECAGCVARAVPWAKRAATRVRERAVVLGVHTAYGRRRLPRAAVVPSLTRFANDFARLAFPVALDVDGGWAERHGAEGTPHWLVWDAEGRLERSVFGSQQNALTRLDYVLAVWDVGEDADEGNGGGGDAGDGGLTR